MMLVMKWYKDDSINGKEKEILYIIYDNMLHREYFCLLMLI